MKIFGIVRSALQLITDRFVADDLRQPNLTLRGNIAVEPLIVGPVGPVPTVAVVDDNAVVPAQTVALGITENYVYNTVAGAWNRASAVPDNVDGQAALTQGTQGVIARLQGWNGATYDRVRSQGDNADSVPVSANGHVAVWSHSGLFNGTSFDRSRGNEEFEVLPSAVRAVTTVSADITIYNAVMLASVFTVTAVPGIETLTFSIEGKNPVTGLYTTIVSNAAISLAGTYGIIIGISAINIWTGWTVPSTGLVTFLPRTIRVRIAHSGAGNWTYSVAGFLRV